MPDDKFVKGQDELIAALKELPLELSKGELRAGLTKGAQFLRDRLKEAAPVSDNVPPRGGRFKDMKPGGLKRGIKARARRGTRTEASAAVTGPFYAKLVEKGHTLKKHRVLIGHKLKNRRAIYKAGEVIGHVPANPFIRNTFEANKDQIMQVIRMGIVNYLARRFARMRQHRPKT